jgi:mevalonate kinase
MTHVCAVSPTFNPHMRHYPSKLLLFGEHILLLGARALAVPVPKFWGRWAETTPGTPADLAGALAAFANSATLGAIGILDIPRFKADIRRGLYFQSTIPQGYGLGSSGALCAAIYDRYALHRTSDLSELKGIFSAMESFFHGKSSGIDPLTSYLNRPLWIDRVTEVRIFEAADWEQDEPVVFLLDTKLPRQTGPLVAWFLAEQKKQSFSRKLETVLLPAHQAMLEAWQFRSAADFWTALQQVSAFQLDYLPPMIPENLRAVWKNCLSGTDITLKICGAGGGGFMLGFTKNKDLALEQLKPFPLIFPFETYGVAEG